LERIGILLQTFRHRYGQNSRRGGGGGDPGPDYHLTKTFLENGNDISRVPERAAFGLPYAQEYRSIGSRMEFVPNAKAIGRRASPVLIKIVRLAGNKYTWVVSHLPAKFLPSNITIKAESNKLKGHKLKPAKSFGTAIQPTAVGYSGGGEGPKESAYSTVENGTTLVLEFIKTLEGFAVRPDDAKPSNAIGKISVIEGTPAKAAIAPAKSSLKKERIVWEKAILSFKPNNQEIIATGPKKEKAFTFNRDLVPISLKEKFFIKRKSIELCVIVKKQGNQLEIVEIQNKDG
jgi:hypothetical protein